MQASNFWSQFLRAVDTDPRQASEICGASGLAHPVLGIGVDDARRRLIVVSGDANGRATALAQADVQAAIKSYRVLFCRPFIVSVMKLGFEEDDRISILGGSIGAMKLWYESGSVLSDRAIDEDSIAVREALTRIDLKTGLCPIPMDDFSTTDIEMMCSARNLDDTRTLLQRLQLLQYFFPPPDQLALGLIDRGELTPSRVLSDLEAAPQLGHPYAAAEIISVTSLSQIVEALQEQGLVVEGEMSLEVTPAGKTIRSSVQFKPREGLVSKLLNRVSVTLNLKDLLGRP